jgi:hypothetical protein
LIDLILRKVGMGDDDKVDVAGLRVEVTQGEGAVEVEAEELIGEEGFKVGGEMVEDGVDGGVRGGRHKA